MKKVLLCDANFCVLPMAKILLEAGYELSVVGNNHNDPAHQIAHHSISIDYSNTEELHKHIIQNKYAAIIPGCNDMSYMSLAYIANDLGYTGFDDYAVAETIHHKDKFRAFAKKMNYPTPKATSVYGELDSLSYPVLLKPIDSFSGKGIRKVDNLRAAQELWKEVKKYSASGCVVAEEFVTGDLYSHSAFVRDGKVVIDFFVNEYCTVYPYQVNSSNVSSSLSNNIQFQLREWTEKFVFDLGLCDGLIHTQFISDNQCYYLIEVARRCPGDLYSELITRSTGVDYAKLYIEPFCSINSKNSLRVEKHISRHTVSTDHDIIFIGSKVALAGVDVTYIPLKTSGEHIKAAPYGKSGIYFIEHTSQENMTQLTKDLKDYVHIETLDRGNLAQ